MFYVSVLLIPYLPHILCRNAIDFFLKHRKIQQTTVMIFENELNTTIRWIEYRYTLGNDLTERYVFGRTLKVGIYVSDWMKYDSVDCRLSQEGNKTIAYGYHLDVVDCLQKNLNICTEFVVIDNSTLLHDGGIDFLVCHPEIQDLPLNVTESHPLVKSNLLLIYKPEKLYFTKDIFILTFAGSLWVVFFAIMILLAISLRISTRKYSMIKENFESWTWVEITLWSIAAACQQGLSHTPSGFASCLIFFLGYLMAYLLYTGFAAAITSILVENVETYVDLKHARLQDVHLISTEYNQHHIKKFREKFLVTKYVSDLHMLFEQLNRRDTIGIGPEISIKQYMEKKLSFDELSSYQSTKINIRYTKGFLMSKNSPWIKQINKHLVSLDEFGILQKLLRKNIPPSRNLHIRSGYSSAGLEHVGSANLLFLGGVLMSLIFFIAEFALYFYNQGRNHTINKN